jgi:poly-gamma-glutamate synthesis protein (capsule biosynthesis protein)
MYGSEWMPGRASTGEWPHGGAAAIIDGISANDGGSVLMEEIAKVLLGGDVMLGRLVRERIRQFGPGYPLGAIAPTMQRADLTVVNLECAITAHEGLWPGVPKAFYFGAPPEAVHALVGAEVDLVSLANNHTLDFGVEGLEETQRLLRHHGILFAGAGATLAEARAPVLIERKGILFGMVAYCDHQEDFAASAAGPGIAYLDLSDEARALDQIRDDLDRMRNAGVDWPILSLHWGPNTVDRPSPQFVRLAHAAIESGCGILFGHSAHVFHGIEMYQDSPIIYSAGDLVDDYYVDPDSRNDYGLLIELEVSRYGLRRIDLHPVVIEKCRVVPAMSEQHEEITRRMTTLCAEMGTTVRHEGDHVWIDARHEPSPVRDTPSGGETLTGLTPGPAFH